MMQVTLHEGNQIEMKAVLMYCQILTEVSPSRLRMNSYHQLYRETFRHRWIRLVPADIAKVIYSMLKPHSGNKGAEGSALYLNER